MGGCPRMSQTLAAGESGFPDLWPRSDQVYVSQAKYPVDGLVMIYIYISYIYIHKSIDIYVAYTTWLIVCY
jgi:hypothetical protein